MENLEFSFWFFFLRQSIYFIGASQGVQWQRICLPVQETQVQSLSQEDSLEKEMATHSSILVWKFPWTEEPGAWRSPWGCKESGATKQLCIQDVTGKLEPGRDRQHVSSDIFLVCSVTSLFSWKSILTTRVITRTQHYFWCGV